MWTSQPQTKASEATPVQASRSPVAPSSETPAPRVSDSAAKNSSRLGSTLSIKGTLSGAEDLQIDGKVEGPISLAGQKLVVGPTGQLASEVTAREAVVHGRISGNISAGDRVEIKKGSAVIGDITTARIGIEDGAHFKGRIEIDPTKSVKHIQNDNLSVLTGH